MRFIIENKQNSSFINKNCDICGKSELVLSSLKLSCGYGSKYDGETLTIKICSSCSDKVYNFIKQERIGNNHNSSKSKGH